MSKPDKRLGTRTVHLLSLIGLIGILVCETSLALTPPRPGEIERYQDDGTLTERQNRAQALGNDRIDPLLAHRLRQKLAAARGKPVPAFAPPLNWRGGLPATGNPRTLVILVDFPDCPHTGGTSLCPEAVNSTVDDVAEKFFGEGSPADAPYESLSAYYRRASHATLHIGGDVLGWYRARYKRAYYEALEYPDGNEALMMEALDHYDDEGQDFAQYDNDDDGRLDAIFLKWTGPDNGWANFWWAYQGDWWTNSDYRIDGKSLGKYVWSWIENLNEDETVYRPNTDIHETGHLLGLPDYYDYDASVGPQNGVGSFDMMDGVWGDHNAFSKTLLGWVDPIVVSRGTQRLGLRATSEAPEAVMVTPQAESGIFGDLFIAEYRRLGTGNDPSRFANGTPGTSGLAIWHVNAALDAQGLDFLNDNSYTNHKLLRLMEADGLEEIEHSNTSYVANAGDLYVQPSALTPTTRPNSHRYDPDSTRFEATVPSDIHITDLSAGGGDTMTATFAIGTPDVVSPGSYHRKVRAYFEGALGRAPTASELDDWSTVLFDSKGSVWRPRGDGLQRHLSDLVGWGTELPTPVEAGAQVEAVLINLFGTARGIDRRLSDYYVEQLVSGGIRARGLVNAFLNDLSLMPRVDGRYGKPNGWTGGPGEGLLTSAQLAAYRARVEATD
jgi:M6 family metalloprotease-like protein